MIDSMYTVRCMADGLFEIELDRSHPVFAAHFPQRAVLPGAVMLEIVRRLAGGDRIVSIRSVKFLTPLFPDVNPVFVISITRDGNDVRAVLHRGDTVFSRISMQVEGCVKEA